MLHNDSRVTVLDNRHADDLEILIFKNDLLIVLFLPQPECRRLDRRVVPTREVSRGFKKEKLIANTHNNHHDP